VGVAAKTRKRRWLWWLPVGAAGIVVATIFNPAFLLNLVARLQRYDVVTDVAYASDARQKLDVYSPRGASGAPVLVFFYGGSWQAGSKSIYPFLASTLAARGYVVVVPDYRVYPQVKFPGFLEDGAKAIRWTRDNVARYGGDPSRMFAAGHSAGAHIAAMLALDSEWLAGVGLDPRRDLAGLIGVSGPYDFLPLKDDTLKIIFEGDNRPQTQPITFAEGRKPPALLLTGAEDTTVYPRNTKNLAAKLRRSGNIATDLVYRHFGHISILLAFAPFLSNLFPLLTDIDAFVHATGPASAEVAAPATARAP
jgi:acetyl esterase/lipase